MASIEKNSFDFKQTSEDTIAGVVVSVECTIGLFMLGFVLYGCYRIPKMRSTFGILTVNQNIAQIVACINSFSFYLFGLVFDFRDVLRNAKYFGGITSFILPTILLSFLLMSVNRFIAVAHPLQYDFIFKRRIVFTVFFIIWLGDFLLGVYVFFVRDCYYVYYHSGWTFGFDTPNEKCGNLLLGLMSYLQLFLTFLILIIDIATLVVLVCCRSRLYQSHSNENKSREIGFAKQVLIQGIVFIGHALWYEGGSRFLPGFIDERWRMFLVTSFSSNLLHIFDPLVVFTCNREFRTWLTPKFLAKKQSTIDVAPPSVTNFNTRI